MGKSVESMEGRLFFIFFDFIELVIFSIIFSRFFEKYFLWILLSRLILWGIILLWPSKRKDKKRVVVESDV